MTTKIFAAALLLASLWACSPRQQSEATPDIIADGTTYTLPEGSAVAANILTDTIGLRSVEATFTATGEVRPIPATFAEIAVPYTGRIVRSFVRLGQLVAKGSPLFQISSADYSEAARAYLEAKAENELALRNYERKQRLYESKVASATDVEEARAESDIKQQACDNAAAALAVFGVAPADMRPGHPLTVSAPIAGKIVADNIVLGQYVKEDAEPLLQIADLRKVWVVASVKEKDLGLVRDLSNVEITLAAIPDTVFGGTLYHVNDILDPDTRSIEVIIECDNARGLLKPNLYATVRLLDAPEEVLCVPNRAILRDENEAYVIRATGPSTFEKVSVLTGASADGYTVVREGVAQGDAVVTKGAFYFLESN